MIFSAFQAAMAVTQPRELLRILRARRWQMPQLDSKEWFLSLFSKSDRSRILTQAETDVGWAQPSLGAICSAAVILLLRDLRSTPLRILWAVFGAYLITNGLSYVVLVLPHALVGRPYDDSFLSSFWLRRGANVLVSTWVFNLWSIAMGPFAMGLIAAWLSRGREFSACTALVVSNLVITASMGILRGHLGLGLWWMLLGTVTWRQVPFLAPAFVLRRWVRGG